ncbi:hypothetical protein TNCV_2859071 [Trichonephila clavipes]|nr:hypothetical protein TNCV_2859071 [Trichonephila clavipes]
MFWNGRQDAPNGQHLLPCGHPFSANDIGEKGCRTPLSKRPPVRYRGGWATRNGIGRNSVKSVFAGNIQYSIGFSDQ